MARWVPSTVKGRRFVRCSYLFHLSFPTFRFAVKFSSYFALFLLSPSFACDRSPIAMRKATPFNCSASGIGYFESKIGRKVIDVR